MRFGHLPIAVFDIDGTLSLPGDRMKCIIRPRRDWDEFYDRVIEDEPNEPIMGILFGLIRLREYRIVYLTSRRESSREMTMKWFDKVGIILQPEDLFMRKEHDYRPDTIVKPELVKDLLPQITMAFEDRASMTKKWRELGITCLQVAEGNF
jgi:hypothetical protein